MTFPVNIYEEMFEEHVRDTLNTHTALFITYIVTVYF